MPHHPHEDKVGHPHFLPQAIVSLRNRVGGGQIVYTAGNLAEAGNFYKTLAGEMAAPDDMVQAWAEEMSRNKDFVISLGGEVVESTNPAVGGYEHPGVKGAEFVKAFTIGKDGKAAVVENLFQLFQTNLKSRGITILWGTPGKRLIQNPETREIIGVYAEKDGKTLAIKAKRAVCLACGGYESNQGMLKNFNMGRDYHFIGPSGHDGDGITMALAVGADLWHMKAASAGASYWQPGMPVGVIAIQVMYGRAGIVVDKHAQRFSNDLLNGHNAWMKLATFEPEEHQYTRIPCYNIFDEKIRSSMPMGLGFPHYAWSADNLAEVKSGLIKQANTIKELATLLRLDAEALSKTVSTYNEYCAAGQDPQFGKAKANLVPLATPPFYGAPLYPGGPNTQGGPRRNAQAQVVDPYGNPIPRLYSNGELGSIYGIQYPGGGNVGECMAFGRIAGKNAAAEKPWGAA